MIMISVVVIDGKRFKLIIKPRVGCCLSMPTSILVGKSREDCHLLCQKPFVVYRLSWYHIMSDDSETNHQDRREDNLKDRAYWRTSPIDEILASKSSEMAATIFSHSLDCSYLFGIE